MTKVRVKVFLENRYINELSASLLIDGMMGSRCEVMLHQNVEVSVISYNYHRFVLSNGTGKMHNIIIGIPSECLT